MNHTENFSQVSTFMTLISGTMRALSKESAEIVFSPETLKKAAECSSSQEFFRFLDSLNLVELKNIKLVDECNTREGTDLDKFFQTKELPSTEVVQHKMASVIESIDIRKTLSENVEDGAMAGAAVGGLIGGLAGGSVGSAAGAVAGAIGGAIGGVINWGLGR